MGLGLGLGLGLELGSGLGLGWGLGLGLGEELLVDALVLDVLDLVQRGAHLLEEMHGDVGEMQGDAGEI